ncbi:helix-turn-helix domain-containing protein [Algibacter lectus]|uniref:AraC-like DNA-binding protein n=1 Tax=Algibacter lectus TaxID=221126 RepID=A0A4R8M8S1_9FLAO|nr:AraC family transcriptional regulator [Algibacter lectus]MWW25424.1 helix-turn-helix domain-containing protein [Algibacter lectus]TDY61368.1 AraC-like DNA-binding protein [Algibacter lectus]
MKTILKSSMFENNVLVKRFEKDFKTSGFIEQKKQIDYALVKGTLIEISINGLRILIRNVKTEDYSVDVQHDFPFFKLQFEIEGSSFYEPLDKCQPKVYIPNAHYNLFYLPKVQGTLTYKKGHRKTLEILFTENYLKDIIGENFNEILHRFGTAISRKKPFFMWDKSQPITNDLQNHINEIVFCNYHKDLKKPYLEAKIKELLILLLAQTNDNINTDTPFNLPETDYNAILKVERYINTHLKDTLTIPELAIIAGMNTTKLKQGFKLIFSTTIFKYISCLRMEQAKKQIVEKKCTVAEAAYHVGYKHPQHFTVAFKKIYGYLPSDLT